MEDTNTCIRTHTRTHVRTHTHTHTPSSPAPAVTVQWLGPRQRPHRTHRHLWLRDLPLTDPDLGWLKRKVGLACSGLWPSLGLHLHSVWDNMGEGTVCTQMRSVGWFSQLRHALSMCGPQEELCDRFTGRNLSYSSPKHHSWHIDIHTYILSPSVLSLVHNPLPSLSYVFAIVQ